MRKHGNDREPGRIKGQAEVAKATGARYPGQQQPIDEVFGWSLDAAAKTEIGRIRDGAAAGCRGLHRGGRPNGRGEHASLRPDPDRIPIKDTILLRELSDRLYEHNFDPEPLDSKNGMRVAIRQFQQKTDMTPTGEPTGLPCTRTRISSRGSPRDSGHC